MRSALIMFGFILLALPASAQDKNPPKVLTLSKTAVWSLAFSPDGKTLASGSVGRPPDNDLKLWDGETGKLKASLTGHTDHIFCVTFSPDGKTLATTGFDKTVRLWDVADGKEKAVVVRDPLPLKTVRFSADGKTLGVAGLKWLRLLDVDTGKEKVAFQIPSGGGHCFNPTLELLTLSPDATYIHLIDTATSKTRTLLTGHKGEARAMAFSADGKWLASCATDNKLRVWDVAAGKQTASFAVEMGRCVAFSKDGKTLAVGLGGSAVRLWDLAANKELPALQAEGMDHQFSVAFSPDGKTLAAGGMGTIRLWSLETK